ncbi:MAG TPA: pyruvate, phosphate dikinase [SAR324 cluster bacterium]|jgi:pyruvate,orthophosphate dikinase|nr:pyruvate, phosphate dikinase [Deltaproteobacteria bacterium]HJL85951.1 pyruvate, phosphate dikinase [SAR324 cluster bacterium]HJO43441.1 pyruvate, phosphate dikinase [SAR324 cluster bacterium]
MKRIYTFGNRQAEGSKDQKGLLGGKGANLAEMVNIGLPVPPGFTISTSACQEYYDNVKALPAGLMEEVESAIQYVEGILGKTFGGENPLLFSVRSGAAISMPGMMDTVLNLGLNDTTVEALAKKAKNEWFAYDSFRRFLQMFGNVALEIEQSLFEEKLEAAKAESAVHSDQELSIEDIKKIVSEFKNIIKEATGEQFPEDPKIQLRKAIEAVFASWNNDRAIYYRNMQHIPHDIGTGVNVQSMVYGNMGETSGTGVAFTRNPATGEKILFGEYLKNAQGEDVVAGIRTPEIVSKAQDHNQKTSMEENWPKMYEELQKASGLLENHYHDMQDIEFTIEEEKFYLLQTRNGERSGKAMVKVALDFYNEGSISKEEVILRMEGEKINEIIHPTIAPNQSPEVLAQGLPASPGVATGHLVFSCDAAETFHQKGKPVILCRVETSPEDIHGMNISEGIITARGGMTSHAAVVARGIGTPCISGCGDLKIHYKKKTCRVMEHGTENEIYEFNEGDFITINGSSGEIIKGKVETIPGKIDEDLGQILSWTDSMRTLTVRTNADTPRDAEKALEFGAEGIGLCRTEHMFFEEDRINIMREMILAHTEEERKYALNKLLPFQREDFVGIYKAMGSRPVTVRLIDPPLHEFLPEKKEDIEIVAKELGRSYEEVKAKMHELSESNPMLGLRGCRLGILFPEVIKMQAQAIFEAAFICKKEGLEVSPEIMVPLVANVNELKHQRAIIENVYEEVSSRISDSSSLNYSIGTMIELPRAALTANEIAQCADFFSFGTNDLTQTTYGLSRDDAGKFLPMYKDEGFIKHDPFVVLDQVGVGQLVQMGTEKGRSTQPKLKVGICGEHGGEPRSIEFCHKIGLDYVSCSPFRVPVARIAAAQAALKDFL